MLLSIVTSNRLDKLINSSNKEDVIYCYQTKNATSLQLQSIKNKRVANNSEIEKKIESAN